jgi:uncharacterized membrane protein
MEDPGFTGAPVTSEPTAITDDDKLWALLSWIFSPIVPIIVLLMEDKKARPFIKYNAVHALAVGIAVIVLYSIISAVTLGLGCFIGWLPYIYQIYLGIQAYNGKWVNVPVITDFVKSQGWI